MQNAEVFKWDDLPVDSPMPLLERQRIIGNKMMISNVVLKKGCFVNSHSHENEQFALVVSGEVRFGLGKEGSDNYRELVLKSGEVLYLPSFVEHSAFAIEETRILDIFSPPSQLTGVDLQKK